MLSEHGGANIRYLGGNEVYTRPEYMYTIPTRILCQIFKV